MGLSERYDAILSWNWNWNFLTRRAYRLDIRDFLVILTVFSLQKESVRAQNLIEIVIRYFELICEETAFWRKLLVGALG